MKSSGAPFAAPAKVMITEGKPFSADSIIEAEAAKMEELGEEMRREIRTRAKR